MAGYNQRNERFRTSVPDPQLNLPKEITKEQLNEFMLLNAKEIDEYADSIRSGFIVTLQRPVAFPDGMKYVKIFIGDSTDYEGIAYIDGIVRNHINKGGAFVKVYGFAGANSGDDKRNIHIFFENLKRSLNRRPEEMIPEGHESWRKVGEDIWQNDMPPFQLIVQRSGQSYYASVRDKSTNRLYSDATPYPTLQDAMDHAMARALFASRGRLSPVEHEYMPRDTRQRRLF